MSCLPRTERYFTFAVVVAEKHPRKQQRFYGVKSAYDLGARRTVPSERNVVCPVTRPVFALTFFLFSGTWSKAEGGQRKWETVESKKCRKVAKVMLGFKRLAWGQNTGL